MRKETTVATGIIDRAGVGGAGTIRARVSRKDRHGRLHEPHDSWNYTDATSRQAAIDTAQRWRLDTLVAIRATPDLKRQQEALGIGKTLRTWIVDYIRALGYELAEVEDGIDKATGAPKWRIARTKARVIPEGIKPPDRTDAGADNEADILRGWLRGYGDEPPPICDMSVDAIEAADIDAAIQAQVDAEKPVEGTTVRRRLAALKAVAEYARKEWKEKALLEAIDQAEWPDGGGGRPGKVITMPEWRDVMAQGHRVEPLTLAAIRYLRWTGCRRSEAGRVEWPDIAHEDDRDGATWRIHVRQTKTPKKDAKSKIKSALGRKIPIDEATWDALVLAAQAQHIMNPAQHPHVDNADQLRAVLLSDQDRRADQRRMSGAVFAGLGLDAITHGWSKMSAAAKVEARLHDLRHTRTTEYIAATGSLLDAAALSGHSDTEMLRRYYHEAVSGLEAQLQAAKKRASAESKKRLKAALDAERAAGATAKRAAHIRRAGRAPAKS